MNDTPDLELLRCYAETGAEEAFAELVKRHVDLVWAAAWRVSGDRELARDVAQTVFTDLARKAKKLPGGTVLPGWLYRAACYAAAMHIRGEARRAQREQQAMRQDELQQADAAEARAAAELQPVLDAALADLTETDRDAVVLRFLAGRSFAEVGATLGTNEDAAQKRVSRALERLREAFRKRGVAVSGGIVAAALGAAGTQAAPAGLAGVIATASLAGAGTAAWGTFSAVTFMKSKLALGIVGTAIVATTLAWQQRSITRLTDENAGLRRQATAPPVPAATPATADIAELNRLRGEHAELLRLRGEVSQLRKAGPTAANDLSRRLQSAETRAAQAEAEAALVVATQKAQEYTTLVVNVGKNLRWAARSFAQNSETRFPTTFDEIRPHIGLPDNGTYPGGISPDFFEFFPHERVISEGEPMLILFREKAARQMPDGTWQRIYCLADSSVQVQSNATGDFKDFERGRTGTTGNAPKKP